MSLLDPQSIAVIGASRTPGKVGHDIFKNLLTQGYQGAVYPVNPKGGEILEHTAYASVGEIPGEVEMAVIVIPGKFVPGAVKECIEKGVQHAVVISAGFAEVHTDEGIALEEELLDVAKGINLIGPNCLGLLRPSLGMNASFAKDLPAAGSIALISQSGAMAVALMDAAGTERSRSALNIGYSWVASIGNKSQLDECDYLELCGKDEKTNVIGFYLESIKDGQRFLDVAKRVGKGKHIVLLKSGVSEHGRQAASSHTGALAGNDAAIEAACRQAGIHRAHSAAEFLDLVRVLSTQPPLLSPRVAVITNAGGPGILATDAAEACGLDLVQLEEKTKTNLGPALPAAASMGNPIDVIGDADTDRYRAALDACGHDPNIDGLCVILTPQVMTPCQEIAQAIADWNQAYPLMPVTTSFMGAESVGDARTILAENQIPTFETPERAIRALASLLPNETQTTTPQTNEKRVQQAAALIDDHSGLLDEKLTEELFALYDLSLPKQAVASSADEAVAIAQRIGYPVIAKISSPDILHKTDVGGVRANLRTEAEVRGAFKEIMEGVGDLGLGVGDSPIPNTQHLTPEINGILIQQFLPIGQEFIVGGLRDPAFGPLVMVGLGGIYTELFKDTSFRIAPVTEEESYQMLQDLTAWKLLLGMRGQSQRDIAALATVIQRIAQLMTECPHITELDLNPVLVGSDEVVIADVKVVT